VLDLPGDDGVADYANAVGVGDHHGSVEEAGVFHPGCAGHLAIAVEGEPGGEDCVITGFAARMDGRDAGTHGTFADNELAFAGDERGVSDLDAANVGDGVVEAGGAVEGDSEIAGAGFGLGVGGEGEDKSECDVARHEDLQGNEEVYRVVMVEADSRFLLRAARSSE